VNELALFAGAGGGLLASKILGWNTVCAVEIGDYPRRSLLRRQADGVALFLFIYHLAGGPDRVSIWVKLWYLPIPYLSG